MKQRFIKVVKTSAVILSVGCVYAIVCSYLGKGIPCFFHLITGYQCPGCGVSRMCLSILKLDFVSAFRYNQAIFCMIPLYIFLITRYIYVYIKYDSRKLSKAEDILQYMIIVILLTFGILRNFI